MCSLLIILLLVSCVLTVSAVEQSFHLPNLNSRLSYSAFAPSSAKPLTEKEITEPQDCTFHGPGVNCSSEYVDYQIVKQFVRPTDVVLDVGARYGMTSCLIASIQRNNGQLLAVEPDSRAWKAFEENRDSHQCSMWLLKGAIGTNPYLVQPMGDNNARALPVISSTTPASLRGSVATITPQVEEEKGRDFFTFRDVQVITGLTFTALHFDCEGCIDVFFKSTNNQYGLDRLLQNIRLITIDATMSIGAPDCQEKCVDYNLWTMRFQDLGYSMEVKLADPDYPWKFHYVFVRKDLSIPLITSPKMISVFETLKDSLED